MKQCWTERGLRQKPKIKMKVLFIVPYPTEGPSNRYRVEQYLPLLEKESIYWRLRPFITSKFYRILYSKGNRLKKCMYFVAGCMKRLADIIRAVNYDIIFIHIEAFPFGPPLLELIFYAMGKPIIFDFEDAIYLSSPGKGGILRWARFPKKFYSNIGLSTQVIVCNNYLKEKLYRHNPNITVIPTSIDTDKFKLKPDRPANDNLLIGWIGSHTTSVCLKQIIPALEKLGKKYEFTFKVIGGASGIEIPGVKVIHERWMLEKDVENFQSLDIGVYPLPDNEWAMAKTPLRQFNICQLACLPLHLA